MKKILIIVYSLISLGIFGYEPIAKSEELYLKDIPIYYGLEKTKLRLENNTKPIWALNLSGGSARAFAHIGVLKRLEEEGLRPDVIITNSMGSIVGLTYAAGMSVSDIEDIVNTLKLSEFFDIVFPLKGGVIDLHRFESLMFALFGKMDLSETAIPVFVVTEDLKSKRQIILSEGNLVKVLKASFALPFYFQPVNIENYRLIDGGTTALVPIKPFNDLLPNMVVSSTFYAAQVNLNNPITILNVSMDISKSRRSVKQIKEYKPFLIRCDVEEISFMAFDKGNEIITAGYDSADNVVQELINYLGNRDIFSKQTNLEEFDITEELHNNWESLKTRINQTTLKVQEPGWSLNPGLEAWHSFGNNHYLNQNYYPTVKTSLWYDKSLIEGMFFYTDTLTGSILRWEIGLNKFLYLNMEGQLNFSTQDNSFLQYSGNYIYSKAGAILPLYKGFIEPGITAEFVNIDDYNNFKFYIRPGIRIKPAFTNLDIDFRYLIRSNNKIDTYGLSIEALSSISLGSEFELNTRAYGKGAINNFSSGVELTFNDFYRSNGNSLISTVQDYFPSYLILNSNIKWNMGSHLSTLGEIISLSDSSVYFFCDLLITDLLNYNDNTKYNPTIGLGTDIAASLIGLKPYIFSFSGGWDINNISPFITFSLGTVF